MTTRTTPMVNTLTKLENTLSDAARLTPDSTVKCMVQIRIEPPRIDSQFLPLPKTGKK